MAEAYSRTGLTRLRLTLTAALVCYAVACSPPDPASLLEAAKTGDREEAQRLLNHGIDPDVADDAGFRPLHFAAQNGFVDVVTLLIASGANVHARTQNGFVLTQIVGIELRWPTRHSGATPLHVAATAGHTEIIEALIAANADVNAFYAGSFTPLHAAVIRNNMTAAELLIRNGADVNARHWTGAIGTPLDLVEILGYETMAVVLREHGATTSDWTFPVSRLR